MLVVNNQTFATNVVQVITRVWNQVLEPDNLHYWRREIDFSEKTKSSDQSEFKLWLLGQNLVDNWLLTLQPHMLICTHKMAACGVESSSSHWLQNTWGSVHYTIQFECLQVYQACLESLQDGERIWPKAVLENRQLALLSIQIMPTRIQVQENIKVEEGWKSLWWRMPKWTNWK